MVGLSGVVVPVGVVVVVTTVELEVVEVVVAAAPDDEPTCTLGGPDNPGRTGPAA